MRLALLVVAALLLVGCAAEVKAWQRETLAHPCMSGDDRPEEEGAREHMLGAREQGRGATGAEGGGGCGCN